ncbi:MAG TPA: (d)CMP kinase [Polyangiaceae bacterium]|nr:(d)CMP kinase [Polyangiaceae bacterium]
MISRNRPVVAIDGPAGAGKSTVTRLVAARLGYWLLDTGALYRAVALAVVRAGIDWADTERISTFASELVRREGLIVERGHDGEQLVRLDGEEVQGLLRSQEIGAGASRISSLPRVREALLALQRRAAERGGVVVEGRDIGTVVFPDAEAKFFLTASVEVRARRRFDELAARGAAPSLEDVRREVVERDLRDTERAVAPLRRAQDAELVDSSELDLEAVVGRIVERVHSVERRLKG